VPGPRAGARLRGLPAERRGDPAVHSGGAGCAHARTAALCLRQMCVHTCAPRPHPTLALCVFASDVCARSRCVCVRCVCTHARRARTQHTRATTGSWSPRSARSSPRHCRLARASSTTCVRLRTVCGISARAVLLLLTRACALALCRRVGTRCRRRARRTLPRRSWV
jgi:hypothetical protein